MSESHRVLVVDDEPNIVDVISMALRFQGFEVAASISPISASEPVVGDEEAVLLVAELLVERSA